MSVGAEEQRGQPLRWIAGAVAIVIALGIIGGLVYFRFASKGSSTTPPVAVASVNGVNFSCKLPVLAGASAGFVSFPDGAVTIDHSVDLSKGAKGGYGFTYDKTVGKWLPVMGTAVSPDGRSYAYIAQTTGVPGEAQTMSLHTRVIGGSDHLLWQGQGNPMGGPNSVTWVSTGIYFSAFIYSSDTPQGPMYPALYVVDPNKPGAPHRVGPNPPPQPPTAQTSSSYYYSPDQYMYVGGGAAWGVGQRVPKEEPPTKDNPQPGAYGPDRIMRMDLQTGNVSTWYMATGTSIVSLMGLDAQGEPILTVYEPIIFKNNTPPQKPYEPPPVTLLLLTGQNQTAQISAPNPDFHMAGQPTADSHGIWFGGWDQIWLYTPSSGLRLVATIPSGTFPTPSPPPGYPGKGTVASDVRKQMPAYMQGTMLMTAGPCA